jgi:serine/threonine protein kinase
MPLREEKVPAVGFIIRMGKYRLDEVIASGGMGRVWRAQDIYGNTVAIKTLNKDQALSADSVKRFRREAEIMSRLHHRNICHIFEISEHEGLNYIVMEFIDGPTLSDILYSTLLPGSEKCSSIVDKVAYLREARLAPTEAQPEDDVESPLEEKLKHPTAILPLDEVLNFFEKVCEAVQFGHQHGVLHRDIKPGNILVRNDGEPIVSDFGLAKFSTTNNAASFSMSGAVVGTIENMAPEQAESSKTVDARADIYSLGTVLYQMLTGTRHFTTTGNFLADLQALQHHEAPRPRTINSGIEPDLELIILKCLRNDPNERYPRVSALLTDLHRYRRGESISARPLTFWYVMRKIIRRNKLASVVAAVSLFFISVTTLAAVLTLSRELNYEKTARQEADKLRKVAEENRNLANQKQAEALEKENYAIELAKKASEQTALAQQLLDEKQKMEEMAALTLKRKEDFAAKKLEENEKRAQAQEAARMNAASLHKEIARLKAELDAQKSAAIPNTTKELPRLVTPVRIPLFNNGKPMGFVTAPKGAEVEITDETREKYQITNSFGQVYVDKSAVAIPPQYKPSPSQLARPGNLGP